VRSPPERWASLALTALALAAPASPVSPTTPTTPAMPAMPATPTSVSPAGSAASPPAPVALDPQAGQVPTREQIDRALAQLRADPNLGRERQERRLKFDDSSKPPTPATPPSWLHDFFEFLTQSLNLLLWISGAILLAAAAVWVLRRVRAERVNLPAAPPSPAASVELDLRPASLPADIGAAALALLEAGQLREALSLLYRGALSSAVHRYGIEIPPSATEGEALRAVRARLDAERGAYYSELIGAWQSMVYAGDEISREAIARLCRHFASLIQAPAV
jgi:hypothetical protein